LVVKRLALVVERLALAVLVFDIGFGAELLSLSAYTALQSVAKGITMLVELRVLPQAVNQPRKVGGRAYLLLCMEAVLNQVCPPVVPLKSFVLGVPLSQLLECADRNMCELNVR
jgi:hypothetical protein